MLHIQALDNSRKRWIGRISQTLPTPPMYHKCNCLMSIVINKCHLCPSAQTRLWLVQCCCEMGGNSSAHCRNWSGAKATYSEESNSHCVALYGRSGLTVICGGPVSVLVMAIICGGCGVVHNLEGITDSASLVWFAVCVCVLVLDMSTNWRHPRQCTGCVCVWYNTCMHTCFHWLSFPAADLLSSILEISVSFEVWVSVDLELCGLVWNRTIWVSFSKYQIVITYGIIHWPQCGPTSDIMGKECGLTLEIYWFPRWSAQTYPNIFGVWLAQLFICDAIALLFILVNRLFLDFCKLRAIISCRIEPKEFRCPLLTLLLLMIVFAVFLTISAISFSLTKSLKIPLSSHAYLP